MTGMDWARGAEGMIEVISERDRQDRPLRTVLCTETGLVRNDPVPGDEELAKFYSEEYRTTYKAAERPRRRQILRNFRRAANHVRRFRDVIEPAETVLDVGAGSGEFVFLRKSERRRFVPSECATQTTSAPIRFDGRRRPRRRISNVIRSRGRG